MTESEGGHDYAIQERNSRSDGIITCEEPRIEFKYLEAFCVESQASPTSFTHSSPVYFQPYLRRCLPLMQEV